MIAQLRYVGPGKLFGVPARDIDREEAVRYGIQRLIDSGLYVPVHQKMRHYAAQDKALRPIVENKQA